MIVGAPIGGFLSNILGYGGVAIAAGCLGAAMVPLNHMFLPNTRAAPSTASSSTKSSGLSMHRVINVLTEYPRVRDMMIFQLLLGLAFGVYHSMFSLMASDRFSLKASDLGMLQSLGGMLGAFVNVVLMRWLTDHFSETKLLNGSATLLGVSLYLYTFATTWEHLVALCVPMALGSTIMYTLMTAELTKMVPKEEGTVIGLTHANRSLAGVVSPSIGGLLFAQFGFSSIGHFGATMVSMAIAVKIALGNMSAATAGNKARLSPRAESSVEMQ